MIFEGRKKRGNREGASNAAARRSRAAHCAAAVHGVILLANGMQDLN